MIVLDSLVNVLDTVLYLFQLSLVIYIVISLLIQFGIVNPCLLYTSPSPRDRQKCRMPASA